MKTLLYPLLTAFAGAVLAMPCAAQETQLDGDRYAVTVRHADLHPATAGAARHVLARLDTAALAVCGVASSSLREAARAERGSVCWRGAMAGAMVHVTDPLLLHAYHRYD